MKRKTKNIIITLCVLVILVIASLILKITGAISYNEVPTVGNTAGNLNNYGLFCENQDTVYFSNIYDGGCLYSMNPDETNIKKISSGKTNYINAAGKYLFYYQTSSASSNGIGNVVSTKGVYRSLKNGSSAECLFQGVSNALQLVDNYIYYQHYDTTDATTLYKVKIDATENSKVTDYVVNPACAQNSFIYFNGTVDNHYLYRLDTSNDTITLLWKQNIWNPIIQGDFVYYMDILNNYRLCRYNMVEQSMEVLTEDRIDMFNLYGNYIYYQKSSETDPALKRILINGTEEETVAEGIYNSINITSQYVYFMEYGDETKMYHTSTTGAIDVTTFDSAQIAAENAYN